MMTDTDPAVNDWAREKLLAGVPGFEDCSDQPHLSRGGQGGVEFRVSLSITPVECM